MSSSASSSTAPSQFLFGAAGGALSGFADFSAAAASAAASSFSSNPFSASSSTAPSHFGFGAASYFTPLFASQSTLPLQSVAASGERPNVFAMPPSASSNGANSTLFGAPEYRPTVGSARRGAKSAFGRPFSSYGKAMFGLKETEEDLHMRISFLNESVAAFKEQTPTDIQLKPNDGPCIPAHRAILATRSVIFRGMLDSDGFKAPPSDADTVTLSELNTEELKSLLEFLYTGDVLFDTLEKHVYSLYVAAEKYEIQYLKESCQRYMLNSLSIGNAIKILEISYAHSNQTLSKATMNFIVRNMDDIASTKEYEDFTSSNPHLSVQIMRAFLAQKASLFLELN